MNEGWREDRMSDRVLAAVLATALQSRGGSSLMFLNGLLPHRGEVRHHSLNTGRYRSATSDAWAIEAWGDGTMSVSQHLKSLTTISARDYRDARCWRRISDDVKAKGTASLQSTEVSNECEKFALKSWKSVRLNAYFNAYHCVLCPFRLRECF